MKKNIFILLMLICSTFVKAAEENVQIGNIYYRLYDNLTAAVQCRPFDTDYDDGWMYYDKTELYVGELIIPETVEYNGKTYTVTTLRANAFAGSSLLQKLTFSKNITNIESGVFSGCDGLRSITVSEQNPKFFSKEGVMYEKNPVKIYFVPRRTESINFPDGITEIPSSAFQYSYLQSIEIPEGVTLIKDGAMSNCQALRTVILPSTLTSIERNAFSFCTKLTIIISKASTPPAVLDKETTVFLNTPSELTVYVPKGSAATYKQAAAWKYLNNFSEIDEPTAIDEITREENVKNTKIIENNQLIIIKNNKKYNVGGVMIK